MNIHANLPLIEALSAQLTDMLGEDFDAETFWDTLDGETDVLDLADHVIAQLQEDQALAEAAKTQASALSARARRLSEREKAHKAALLSILRAADQKKLERPAATISRRSGSVSVRIVNEADIPSQLMAVKEVRSPDKTAIKKQIEAGEDVPGAELVRGADSVTVRVG